MKTHGSTPKKSIVWFSEVESSDKQRYPKYQFFASSNLFALCAIQSGISPLHLDGIMVFFLFDSKLVQLQLVISHPGFGAMIEDSSCISIIRQ
jgi:hypothetical protein